MMRAHLLARALPRPEPFDSTDWIVGPGLAEPSEDWRWGPQRCRLAIGQAYRARVVIWGSGRASLGTEPVEVVRA